MVIKAFLISSSLERDLSEASIRISVIQEKIEFIDKKIEEQTNQISKTLIKHEQYLEIRDKVIAVENSKKKLFDMSSRIQELNDRIDNTKVIREKVQIKKLSDDLMVEFCGIVQALLDEWSFIEHTNKCVVDFNSKVNDIVVSGKTKASYGKGARAIINSSFLIAIMLYCQQHGLAHPGFVVLDSPLTTYKEKDKQTNGKNEDVDISVKSAFFYSLAKTEKNLQIIIFDNEIPPEDISGITYHHFTGNSNIYRTGFVPM